MSTFSRTAASTNSNDVINGTTGNDTLKGLDGNDRLFGDRGRDRLLGGDGNDTLIGGGGNDYFNGGRGSDTADYSDQSVDTRIHLGSEFARFINRSWADETLKSIENIVAGSGDDDITGNDDANLLQGGDGDDYLNGGKGKDTLEGGAGNDTLDGGGGTDLLDGGEGFDIADYSGLTSDVDVELWSYYNGNHGNIIFKGKSWDPETLISIEGIRTGSGDDRIDAGWDNTNHVEIDSGAGNDTISGSQYDDVIYGGAGNDQIYGNDGSDTLYGGDGDDDFGYDDGGVDFYDGGKGVDTVEFSMFSSHDYFIEYGDYSYSEQKYALTAGIHVDLSLDSDNVQYVGIENLSGADESNETLVNVENVKTNSGYDRIVGSNASNILRGGDDNDTLDGGKGSDKLYGGSGNDILKGGGGTDSLYGGYGLDIADYSTDRIDIVVDLETGTTEFPTKNWKWEKLSSIEGAFTGSGDDTLQGNEKDNFFDAGLGTDVIRGGSGNDTVSFDSHTDDVEINIRNGFADVSATGDENKVYSIENAIGGGGDDKIVGDRSANRLDGNDGDDLVKGLAGEDILVLSRGDDTIRGGADRDVLLVDFGKEFKAKTTVHNYWDDYYSDYSVTSSLEIELNVDLKDGIATFNLDGENTAKLKGIEVVAGSNGADTISGSGDSDEIWARDGADRVQGRGGDDLIVGGGIDWEPGKPQIEFDAYSTADVNTDEASYGGGGNDTIYGSGVLDGGNGDDRLVAVSWWGTKMYGGNGADKFVFDSRTGYHDDYYGTSYSMSGTVADFDAGEGDKLLITLPEWFFEYNDDPIEFVGNKKDVGYREVGIFQENGDTVVHFNSDDYWYFDPMESTVAIRLTDYTGELTESDILFV
ncbi:calcium-binding protein [Amaricoccus tamworthensis]|uniref:calcium-binding protein n=1 Tax=Amaricoccus tamworthensis TaxID=57002 RepID=UPI003C7AE648